MSEEFKQNENLNNPVADGREDSNKAPEDAALNGTESSKDVVSSGQNISKSTSVDINSSDGEQSQPEYKADSAENVSEINQQPFDPTAIPDETGSVYYAMPDGTRPVKSETDTEPSEVNRYLSPEINVNQTENDDIKQEKSSGFKIFALLLAAAIILVGCFTGGYYVGKNINSVGSAPVVGLENRPTGDQLSTNQVYEKVNPSIVGIITYNQSGESSSASGVIYSEDGYIVTNDHIYSEIPSAKFKIIMYDGSEHNATFVAGDSRSDLAVLKMDASGLTPATFGNSDESVIGEGVVAIGRPAGATNKSNISQGIISATAVRVTGSGSTYSEKFIQTDTAINPGSSGGALCNMYGQVIGITSSKLVGSAYEGVGYAIPTSKMKVIVDSLITNKYVDSRAKLGITYLEVDSITAELNGMRQGLSIASVDQSSDLYGRAAEGDTITEVNGQKITTAEVILDVIDSCKPGDSIKLTIVNSKGAANTYTVRLGADQGSSSYSTSSSGKGSTSSEYNQSEFNFPNGN